MRLERIRLQRFGALDGAEYRFAPGLNLIKGPNESGKSTLVAAILFALFGNPRHGTLQRGRKVQDHVTWGSDRDFCLELVFFDDQGVEYLLHKDWAQQTGSLHNVETGATLTEVDIIQERLADLLGCGSVALYESTACFAQDSLDDLAGGRAGISERLQRIVTGGGDEEAASAVLERLDEAIADLERGWQTSAPVNPGPIKQQMDRLATIEDELANVRRAVARVADARERIGQLEERLEEIERDVENQSRLKDACDTYREWLRRKREAADEEGALERRIEGIRLAEEQLEDLVRRVAQEYPGLANLSEEEDGKLSALYREKEELEDELGDAREQERLSDRAEALRKEEAIVVRQLDRLIEAGREIAAAERELGQMGDGFARLTQQDKEALVGLRQRVEILRQELRGQEDRPRAEATAEGGVPRSRAAGGRPVPAALLAVGFLVLVVGLLLPGLEGLARGAIALVGLALGVGGAIGLARATGSEVPVDTAELQERRRALRKAERQLQDSLDHLGCEDWEQYARKLARHQNLTRQLAQLRTRRDTLLDGETRAALDARLEQLALERSRIERALGENGSTSDVGTTAADARRQRLRALEDALRARLSALGCADWHEFSQMRDRYKALEAQRSEARARYATLLGDDSFDDLAAQRKEASRRRRDAEEELDSPDMRNAAQVSPEGYEELKGALAALEEERDDKRQQLSECRGMLQASEHTIDDVHALEERREGVNRSLSHLRERLEVCKLTSQVMAEAREDTMRSARDELEPAVGAHMRRVTGGRYGRVRVDDDLSAALYSADKGDWLADDGVALSQGTADQIYFAARLGLVELVFGGATPPLLLDDPFVTYDARRRREAVGLCQRIGETHQLLLFTCHDAYDGLVEHVVEL